MTDHKPLAGSLRLGGSSLTIGLELALVGAWSAVGFAISLAYGNIFGNQPVVGLATGGYSNEAFIVVSSAVLVLVLVALGRVQPAGGDQHRWAIAVALGVAVFAAVFFPAGIFGHGTPFALSRALTAMAAVSGALWVVLRLGWERRIAAVVVMVMVGAGAAMIIASPKPAIDDWYMLQAATTGLSHGHNIYTVPWSAGIPGESSNVFVYLPGSAVLLWPFHLLFGDVRFGILAVMGVTALLLIRLARPAVLSFAGCLVLLYPRALFGLEQSWIDVLVLCGICSTVYLVRTGRAQWAIFTFAACLTFKQTAWIVLPLAMFWRPFGWRRASIAALAAAAFIAPWAITAPHAFYEGAFRYNFSLPYRPDSLSLYSTAMRHGLTLSLAVPAIGTAVAIGVSVWRIPPTTQGFALSAALVMGVFNVLNKLSFYNEWELSAGLIVLALVTQSTATRVTPASLVIDDDLPASGPDGGCADDPVKPMDAVPSRAAT